MSKTNPNQTSPRPLIRALIPIVASLAIGGVAISKSCESINPPTYKLYQEAKQEREDLLKLRTLASYTPFKSEDVSSDIFYAFSRSRDSLIRLYDSQIAEAERKIAVFERDISKIKPGEREDSSGALIGGLIFLAGVSVAAGYLALRPSKRKKS